MTHSIDQILAALADPNRRRAIDLLCEGPLTAGELAREIDLTPAALSRHLRVLKGIGMIAEVPLYSDARLRAYALRPQPMATLKTWLLQNEARWTQQMDALSQSAKSV